MTQTSLSATVSAMMAATKMLPTKYTVAITFCSISRLSDHQSQPVSLRTAVKPFELCHLHHAPVLASVPLRTSHGHPIRSAVCCVALHDHAFAANTNVSVQRALTCS